MLVGLMGVALALLVQGTASAQEQPTTTTTSTSTTTTAPAEPGQEEGGGETVRGRISYDDGDEQVGAEDVEITVESEDGEFSEEATTDDDGAWEVELPGPGRYIANIDPDTLPDGVNLADEERTSLVLDFSPGQQRTALFRMESGEETTANSTINRASRLTFEGVRFGLIIAMAAVGLSLIFGTTGLVNFAHGEMVTFGALMAYFFNQTLGIHLLYAAPLAIICGGLFGGVFNRGVWQPLRQRGTGLIAMLVTSIGLGLMLRYVFVYQFGASSRSYADFKLQTPQEIGPLSVIDRDLWVMAMSIVLLVAVGLLLQKTRVGKAMRAVADNRDLAESSGIDVERVIGWVWVAGGTLAATGGIFNALSQQVNWQSGFQLLLLMFAGVILGGLGTAYGALVGSLVVGIFYELSSLVIDTEFKTPAALMVLVVVLLIRPQGILGQAERVG